MKKRFLFALLPVMVLGTLTSCNEDYVKKVKDETSFAISMDLAVNYFEFKDLLKPEKTMENNLYFFDSLILNKTNEEYITSSDSVKVGDLNDIYLDKNFNVKEIVNFRNSTGNKKTYTFVASVNVEDVKDINIHAQKEANGLVFLGTDLKKEATFSFETSIVEKEKDGKKDTYRVFTMKDLGETSSSITITQSEEQALKDKTNKFEVSFSNTDKFTAFEFEYTPVLDHKTSILFDGKNITRKLENDVVSFSSYVATLEDGKVVQSEVTNFEKSVNELGNIVYSAK